MPTRFRTACIVVRHDSKTARVKRHLKKHGFSYTRLKPDFVVSLGGDGTFLVAERLYPGVPKLIARQVRPLIEKLVEKMIGPNLTSLGDGLRKYLEAHR